VIQRIFVDPPCASSGEVVIAAAEVRFQPLLEEGSFAPAIFLRRAYATIETPAEASRCFQSLTRGAEPLPKVTRVDNLQPVTEQRFTLSAKLSRFPRLGLAHLPTLLEPISRVCRATRDRCALSFSREHLCPKDGTVFVAV